MMTTQEIADKLVKLCSEGKFADARKSLSADDIVSVEAGAPPGGSRETKGLAALAVKDEYFSKNFEVHSCKVEGPLVAGEHFAVTFKLDATDKSHNKRMKMDEVAVYTVADGKIRREEFFYKT
jgi:ketosteroid isomerase-like protein